MFDTYRTLITGANGFVGRHLIEEFCRRQIPLIAVVRTQARADELTEQFPSTLVKVAVVQEDASVGTWCNLLQGIVTLVHLGGRAHIVARSGTDSREKFWKTNVLWSKTLAHACRLSGVKRLIYASSVKAVTERSLPGMPITSRTTPNPEDEYGRSKLAAERCLTEELADSQTQLFILRTPLIYGPGVKANFLSLMRMASLALPLPIKAIHNKRSLLFVGNLADLIVQICQRGGVSGTYFVCDSVALSTAEICSTLASAMGIPSRLFAVPQPLLTAGLKLLGKKAIAEKLFGNLEIDASDTQNALSWTPPIDATIGLGLTAAWYKSTQKDPQRVFSWKFS